MPVHKEDLIITMRTLSKESTPRAEFKNSLWKELKQKSARRSFFGFFYQQKPIGSRFMGLLVIVIVGLSVLNFSQLIPSSGVDDWGYQVGQTAESAGFSAPSPQNAGFRMNSLWGTIKSAPAAMMQQKSVALSAPSMQYESVSDIANRAIDGFAVGGAKDINNFRENIKNGFLPLTSDITTEGLFYDYYFDIANNSLRCAELFCPTYSTAQSTDPLTSVNESYLSVGLTGGDKANHVEQPNLNLVVVLDISGSMSSRFDQYYYDQKTGERVETKSDTRSKMKIATDSINAMLDHLKPGDQISVVLFDDQAYLAKPLTIVKNTDMRALQKHISELTPQGGTNLESGINEAIRVIGETSSNAQTETRLVVLTDAMPNIGNTSEGSFMSLTQKNADKGIHTTFIGIGVDFNTQLIEAITKVKGANYYSVHSADEFKQRVDKEFEFMVTPLVYDLQLKVESDAWEIEKVYGSPEANQSTGEIMKVNTLFPSASSDEGVKGGVVLLKMRPKNGVKVEEQSWWKLGQQQTSVKLLVSYVDRSGQQFSNEQSVSIPKNTENHFDNSGVRKAVALSKWSQLLQEWTTFERMNKEVTPSIVPSINPLDDWYSGSQRPAISPKVSIIPTQPSQWERTSMPIHLSPEYRTKFEQFRTYLINEKQAIGDDSLQREIDLIDQILKSR